MSRRLPSIPPPRGLRAGLEEPPGAQHPPLLPLVEQEHHRVAGARLRLEDAGHLQELLYAIYALLSSHLWREEQLYLELLSSDREADARRLLRQLS